MLRTEAIQSFLHASPYPLAKLYTPDMEVQVNVARDGGEIITGEFKNRQWRGFSDGLTTWKHFRIPWNAAEDPRYTDREIKFDISEHAESIGMTGWDWVNKRSRWVGFDFDSLVDHAKGLTSDELGQILRVLCEVHYSSLYTSTSGSGVHCYIYIDSPTTEVNTHTEHAAIARAILNKLSAATGLKLEAKVDTLGANMWVWHRRAKVGESFKEIKKGEVLREIPANWRDYLSTVSRTNPSRQGTRDSEAIIAATKHEDLDAEHLELLAWFEKSNALWWWDAAKNMLVCHTFDLKRAHKELKLKGLFETVAEGKEQGHDQNCFCFPLDGGSWITRRHSRGVKEAATWRQSTGEYTTCYYNRHTTIGTAIRTTGGIEGEKDYTFPSLDKAIDCLNLLELGVSKEELNPLLHRETELRYSISGKIIISVSAEESDPAVAGWVKKKKRWVKVFYAPQVIDDVELPDQDIRHVIHGGTSLGWYAITVEDWLRVAKQDAVSILVTKGYKRNELDHILGTCILNHWQEVTIPFGPEYPGDRQWNRNAPQLRHRPKKGKHPSWDRILEHLGRNLDEYCRQNDWCVAGEIIRGFSYLQAWASSIIQYSTYPLPYLTFVGNQNSGKSIFHEALCILFTKGYIRADNALSNQSGFNGELAGSILCIVEETNLSKRGFASDRIRDWVTGRTISIRRLYQEQFDTVNTTHWIQCTNDLSYCPVFEGDTRIVVVKVDPLPAGGEIPKPVLLAKCEEEAPAFVYTLLNMQIPESEGRLRIPVLETTAKSVQMEANRSEVETFISEMLRQVAGSKTLFSDTYSSFLTFVGHIDSGNWTNRRFSKELKLAEIQLERAGAGGQMHLIGWELICL